MRLVGRDAELGQLLGALTRAAASSDVVALVGDPGIGKSTLLDAFVEHARDRLILRARPGELERDLTGSALGDLLEPVTDLRMLPAVQRDALESVLLRSSAPANAVDVRIVGAAVVKVFESLAASARSADVAGLVVVIDDLQWVDPFSAAVLVYAARRLPPRGVLLVAAHRPDPPVELPGRTVPLRGLDDAAMLTIVTAATETGRRPSARTLRALVAAAGGNPLYLRELRRPFEEPGSLGSQFEVPASLDALIGRRIESLSDTELEALRIVALLSRPDVATIDRLGLEPDVTRLEHCGLLDTSGHKVRFDHPLTAAVVRNAILPMARRALHRRLATELPSGPEALHHAALAADAPHGELARALADAAAAVERRGGAEQAAELAAHAARLTPDDDPELHHRLTESARLAFSTGETDAAVAALDRAATLVAGSPERVTELCLRATVAYSTGEGDAVEFAEAALSHCTTTAECIEVESLLGRVNYDDFRAAARHATRAAQLAETEDLDDVTRIGVLLAAGGAAFFVGEGLDRGLHERAIELERTVTRFRSESAFASFAALLKIADELDEARVMLLKLLDDTEDEGSLPFALSHLPQLELWAGRWDLAEEYARRHLEAAQRTGQHDQVSQARTNLATIAAHRGDLDDAVALATGIVEQGRQRSDRWTERSGLALLGFASLSGSDNAGAVLHLRRWHELGDAIGIGDPGYARYEADLGEALVAIGELEEAAALVDRMSQTAHRLGRVRAIGVAERVAALVAAASNERDRASELATASVTTLAATPFVFDLARAHVTAGQVHRRFREKAAARRHLEQAAATFADLGAVRFAERARQELERVGGRSSSSLELTATERRVAELAASGATVKQIGAELFISPKTVEANLTRVYRKLGISGRAQLARRVRSSGDRER